MEYTLNELKHFKGNIQPSKIDMRQLINFIEAEVSQYRYFYQTDSKKFPKITVEVTNANIPHLLGLSKLHHSGLPSYTPLTIFEGLKEDWTLDKLIKGDSSWFEENQNKIIGVLLLYQILHVQQCKVYTTEYIGTRFVGKRYKRDKIYFVILKSANNMSYTVELSKEESNFFPRSLKINDSSVNICSEINIQLLRQERIKTKKTKIKKVKWRLA